MKNISLNYLWLNVMSELALPCAVVLRPLLEGGARVFPTLVRVGGALLISGLGLAVIGALYFGASGPIWYIITYFASIGFSIGLSFGCSRAGWLRPANIY
jgi:hypothetical protein